MSTVVRPLAKASSCTKARSGLPAQSKWLLGASLLSTVLLDSRPHHPKSLSSLSIPSFSHYPFSAACRSDTAREVPDRPCFVAVSCLLGSCKGISR